ncbi:hypothetical protein E2C01_023519 [Portunus trituberculatus]|uniref:Uncharacterized protein n=1 Tax=Portunus trituberculatus TaxID=210409 RepID=A0A5B7E973_PORTR|nr:hypothetical protein [Portunus trituberculatus]
MILYDLTSFWMTGSGVITTGPEGLEDTPDFSTMGGGEVALIPLECEVELRHRVEELIQEAVECQGNLAEEG